MSVPTENTKSTTVESVPESPTTARPLEMDDDDVQETPTLGDESTQKPSTTTTSTTTTAAPAATEETAPPKPPRPMTEQQKNVQVLKEAFPTVEESVIKAVLRASNGRVEPAFNALLEMTDPDAVQREEQPPPPPPRPVAEPHGLSSTSQSQLEADEEYARQLAQQYENVGSYEARTSSRSGPGGFSSRPRQETGLKPNEMYDKEHSFLDDDLPVIKENLRKGFLETQTKVNSWFNNLKKRIDEEFTEEDDERRQQRTQMGPRQGGDRNRRSGDYDRYDADPELLSDDFAGMRFHQDGTPAHDPNRPLANPNLFRPPASSPSPKPGSERKVAFRDNVEDIDAYGASPKLPPKDNVPGGGGTASPGAAKASKWQPLSTVEPSPIAENDPFSLGDSEDERDAAAGGANKDKRSGSAGAGAGGGEIKMEDSERLRQAAAEAMADSLVDDDSNKKPAKAGDDKAAAAPAKKD